MVETKQKQEGRIKSYQWLKLFLLFSLVVGVSFVPVLAASCTPSSGYNSCSENRVDYGTAHALVRIEGDSTYRDDSADGLANLPYAVGRLYMRVKLSAGDHLYAIHRPPGSWDKAWAMANCLETTCRGIPEISSGDYVMASGIGEKEYSRPLFIGIDWDAPAYDWTWTTQGYGWSSGTTWKVKIVECSVDIDCGSGNYCDKSGDWSGWSCKVDKCAGVNTPPPRCDGNLLETPTCDRETGYTYSSRACAGNEVCENGRCSLLICPPAILPCEDISYARGIVTKDHLCVEERIDCADTEACLDSRCQKLDTSPKCSEDSNSVVSYEAKDNQRVEVATAECAVDEICDSGECKKLALPLTTCKDKTLVGYIAEAHAIKTVKTPVECCELADCGEGFLECTEKRTCEAIIGDGICTAKETYENSPNDCEKPPESQILPISVGLIIIGVIGAAIWKHKK